MAYRFQVAVAICLSRSSLLTVQNLRPPVLGLSVGQAIGYFGTYSVDEAAKTTTYHIERSTLPQWDGIDRIVSIVFPTDSELDIIGVTPIQDPSMGPFIPHLNFKRAM
jgi:hypothetical protein